MTKWEIKEFYEENKNYCIAFLIVLALCIAGIWLCYDRSRNEPVYHDTDVTVAELNNRISALESRVGAMQTRLDQAEKTVERVAVGISRSTGYAYEIADGITGAEKRLDAAIQRAGRIENLIADIEAADRQGKASASSASVAK